MPLLVSFSSLTLLGKWKASGFYLSLSASLLVSLVHSACDKIGGTQISGIIDSAVPVMQLVMTVLSVALVPLFLRLQLTFSVFSVVLVQPPHHLF